tara:strand:+ start:509 stop:901 length:393 start_codon:yes stop_codon:yes gene_type:complete
MPKQPQKWDKANHEKYNKYAPDKMKCPYCPQNPPSFYNKLALHTVQRHNITAKELKSFLGLDNKKGLISQERKEILRQHVNNNRAKSIENNLLKKGQATRYKKGISNNYKRSPQTLKRLQQHIKNITINK